MIRKDIKSDDIGRLVIGRSVGESIKIGDITVSVQRVRGKYVWLCVEAPKSMRVSRCTQ